MAGVSIIALGGIWWLGHESGLHERDGGLGVKFERSLTREREVAIRREVNLWTQIGDERQARVELITTMQKAEQLSDAARAKLAQSLEAEKLASAAALAEAKRNIEELKNAATEMAKNWKSGVIPPDITCGVFDGSGCPAPAYPGASPNSEDSLAVRGPAAPVSPAAKLPGVGGGHDQ